MGGPSCRANSAGLPLSQVNLRPRLDLAKRSVVWFLPGAALSGTFLPQYTSADTVPDTVHSALLFKAPSPLPLSSLPFARLDPRFPLFTLPYLPLSVPACLPALVPLIDMCRLIDDRRIGSTGRWHSLPTPSGPV